ncbi:MAG: RNA polymerase sigma factor [Gammaproteobacteria bacterium]
MDAAGYQDLLARCALKDQKAFAALYDAASAHLYGVILRIVRREDLAGDVLQETMLRIWDHAGDYRAGRGSPLTWMTAIARYRSLDHLRRPVNAAPHESMDIEPEDPNGMGPLDTLGAGVAAERLKDCLKALGDGPRQCIVLCFYRGMTHDELATQLDTPLGTVKSWIRRGMERLKGCIEP